MFILITTHCLSVMVVRFRGVWSVTALPFVVHLAFLLLVGTTSMHVQVTLYYFVNNFCGSCDNFLFRLSLDLSVLLLQASTGLLVM